jgi:hypothetical protein
MDKERLYGCLRRVSTMASERVEGIRLSIKSHSVEFFSYNQDFGDAKEEVEVVYEGPPVEIGFNARYLMEALNVIGTMGRSVSLANSMIPIWTLQRGPLGPSGTMTISQPSFWALIPGFQKCFVRFNPGKATIGAIKKNSIHTCICEHFGVFAQNPWIRCFIIAQ